MLFHVHIYTKKPQQIVNVIMKQIGRLVPTNICNLNFAVENLELINGVINFFFLSYSTKIAQMSPLCVFACLYIHGL